MSYKPCSRSEGLAGLIVILGSPGSGKSTLATMLSEKICCDYIDVGVIVRERGMILGRDDERDALIIDEDAVRSLLLELVEEKRCLVVETVAPGAIPRDKVLLAVAVRCDPRVLTERLKQRGYSKRKIRENLEYEALDGSLFDALEIAPKDRVIEVDGCSSPPEKALREILESLKGSKRKIGRFNWSRRFMEMLESEEI